ncbi:hypothetical protein CDL12_27353 [Handroanthus impetiginosus]|uniref:Uncharacterized protein n=1 Tax=Handroanthus impetiginosus TaxID=429701 RepID=A0A2G9G4C0_9LAMI|nr:hypothetical protein CDL12_27353 [Handroanthus impetiginosus]
MTTVLTLPLCPKLSFKSQPYRPNSSPINRHLHSGCRSSFSIKCQAVGEQPEPVYQGLYGPWKVESSDVQEVILYRSGLVTAASSFVIASLTAFLQNSDSQVLDFIRRNLDLFYGLGACGLGLSLYLIHIYVTEIKRALQALWVIGAVGSLGAYAAFAQPEGKSLVEYVIENPTAVWFVGPLFAALTGLVFKEGIVFSLDGNDSNSLCYLIYFCLFVDFSIIRIGQRVNKIM